MPNGNDEPIRADGEPEQEKAQRISRRRWLQLAGIGVAGSTLGIGTASAAETDRPHTILFDATATNSTAEYEFGVTGSVAPHGDVGALETEDTVDGTTVVGAVQGDVDAYRFSGGLTGLDVSGEVDVSLQYNDTSQSGPDRLEIVTPTDGSVEYTFTASGEVQKVLDNGNNSAEDNDSITENDDGTYTVTGLTGNGYGDTFDLHGEVTSFDPADGEYTLFLNGSEVTVAELTGQDTDGGSGADDGSSGSGDGSGSSDGGDTTTHTLEIVTPADGSVEYTLTTSGEIRKLLDNGNNSAEDNDTISKNDDGTYTATGLTGNGYGDAYQFDGEALAFDPQGEFTLYLDGSEVTVAELTGQDTDGGNDSGDGSDTTTARTLEIVTPADGSVEYAFDATGTIRKVLDNGDNSAEDNDTVTQNDDGTYTATGLTGNGYGDAYIVEGDVTAFSPMEGEFALYVDGTQVTTYDLTGEEPPADGGTDDGSDGGSSGGTADGGPIGGGSGYANTVARDDADVVVSTRDSLADALSGASSGDIVYVAGNADVDLAGGNFDVPAGVTVASNRGVSGAPGALLYTDEEPDECLNLYGDARLTGVRLKGPHPGDDTGGDGGADGVGVYDDGEVDNCDIWGFSHGGVKVEGGGRPQPYIHHNVIREINRGGYGYGVSVIDGDPLIEYNYFNFNRHCIAATGSNYGYVARYNHFGPDLTDTPIDVHGTGDGSRAAVRTEVAHNVVEGYIPNIGRFEGNVTQGFQVRGVPEDTADAHDNWFWNPNPPTDAGTWGPQAIVQPETSEWRNVTWSNNYYGEDAGVSFSDVIPGYDGNP